MSVLYLLPSVVSLPTICRHRLFFFQCLAVMAHVEIDGARAAAHGAQASRA